MDHYDVINLGTVVADIPVKIPYNTIDFTHDLTMRDKLSISPGGDAANSSIVLSQLGMKVALVAAVGDDIFGDIVVRKMKERGVDVSTVAVKKNVNTSVSIAVINPEGDRCFLCTKGNNDELGEEDFDYALLDSGAKHLNYSGFFVHPLLDRAGAGNIFKAAKHKGLTISSDINVDLYGLGFETIQPHLKYVDIFLPSYQEAEYITGETEPKRMAEFLWNTTGIKTIIIKLGAVGSYLYYKGKGQTIPAFGVDAVDTTGAGDNFTAGVITSYQKGMDLPDCVRFGSVVAALGIQYVGATNANVTLKAVEEFVRTH